MEPTLEYNDDNYEEDFHEEANDKNKSPITVEVQAQTTPDPPEHDEHYEEDFDPDEASRGAATPNSKAEIGGSRRVYGSSPTR